MAEGQTGQNTGEARLYWGDRLLCVRHSTPPRPFVLGSEPGRCDFVVPEELLGERSLSIDPRTADVKTLGELRVEVALVAAAERWAGLRRISDIRVWICGLLVTVVLGAVLAAAAHIAERKEAYRDPYDFEFGAEQLYTMQLYLRRSAEREWETVEIEAEDWSVYAGTGTRARGEQYDGIEPPPLRWGPPHPCTRYGGLRCNGPLRNLGSRSPLAVEPAPPYFACFERWSGFEIRELRRPGIATLSVPEGGRDLSAVRDKLTRAALECYETGLAFDPSLSGTYRVRIGAPQAGVYSDALDMGCDPAEATNGAVRVEPELGSSRRLVPCLTLAISDVLDVPPKGDSISFELELSPVVPRDSFPGLGDTPLPNH